MQLKEQEDKAKHKERDHDEIDELYQEMQSNSKQSLGQYPCT